MARSARNSTLETRTGRSRLRRQKAPYWVKVRKGLYVGYAKGTSGGAWVMRLLVEGTKEYRQRTIGLADDHQDSNNVDVFDFFEAQDRARKYADDAAHVDAGVLRGGRYTVKDALADYLAWADGNTKSAHDARTRANALILPKLGNVGVERLSSERLEQWLGELASQPARIRTRKGVLDPFHLGTGEAARRFLLQ